MQVKTILNRVHRFKSFVYTAVYWVETPSGEPQIEAELCPRANGRARCGGCLARAPGYDRQPARRFEFVPLWGMKVYLRYAPRRVSCPDCGVRVEHLPWASGKRRLSGSSVKSHVQGEPRRKLEVELKTLNSIASSHDLMPNLLKLDLQGYELEALLGASNLLNQTEVIITEFGCLSAYKDRTTPHDLLNLMYEYDYCLYDIFDLIYRPFDNALTGGDFVFVKNYSLLKSYKGYK